MHDMYMEFHLEIKDWKNSIKQLTGLFCGDSD